MVEFESERSTVVANFRIESAYYPSFPIEVRLDLMSGDQDLETIKKALVKAGETEAEDAMLIACRAWMIHRELA